MTAGIDELTELDDLRELAELFAIVWERPGEPPITSDVLRALSHSGNYVAGARSGGRLIGGIAGWLGMHDGGELHLHSHILGVLPGDDAKGLGFALKQHQRTWCLARSVSAVEWTFDPLIRRNAHFNFTKLGAQASRYLIDFYGRMEDGINAGDESDRILIRWELDSARTRAAADGSAVDTAAPPDAASALRVGLSGEPEAHAAQGRSVLVQVPEDIVAVRRRDAALGRRWRLAVREVLGDALARGYRVTGFTRTFEYLLERS